MTNPRSGLLKKNLSGEMAYYSFLPTALPPNPAINLDSYTLVSLRKATANLGLLDGLTERIPNQPLFLSMYIRKEALLSSQIEGTQATLDDILDPMIDSNTNQDVADVINYIKATYYALERLKELPLCMRLLREVHSVLLSGVRGDEKQPGEFRISQNWIGPQGSNLKTAKYVPPNVEDMTKALGDLEIFMNQEDDLDPLIKVALIHYQFETIHPFLDGNGRIGRLLITLFLLNEKVLKSPALYVSYFLKLNRVEYYDRMMDVRRNGSYEQWISFFIKAFVESTEDAIQTIDEITKLRADSLKRINSAGFSSRRLKTRLELLTYLEASPIIELKKTAEAMNVSYNTLMRAVNDLVDIGLLVQQDNKQRGRTYSYENYLKILRRETLPL